MTVRELIQNLIFNCDLDDTVCIEVKQPIDGDNEYCAFQHYEPRHVFRIGSEKEALIECHDE